MPAPRPGLVWINTNALARTLDHARAAGADPDDLIGAERALASRRAPSWRFTMLIQHGFLAVHDLILEHARATAYTARVFNRLIGTADQSGLVLFEADELAEACRVPRALIYSVLLDLEREPIAAITRVMKGRHVRGAQLTSKVHHLPAPKPERRARVVAA